MFRYLRQTPDIGLHYRSCVEDDLVGHCDADWAGDLDERKSVSGYTFSLCGAPISWKQTSVALSTAEAEYVALSSTAQEAVWLASELRFKQSEPTVIFEGTKPVSYSDVSKSSVS